MALWADMGKFLSGALILGVLLWLWRLLQPAVSSYLTRKGQNRADAQDMPAITDGNERAKRPYVLEHEEVKLTNQLRLAALDRRLEVHQEAFTLWNDLGTGLNDITGGEILRKCKEWWPKNCLYLEPGARAAFMDAVDAAEKHAMLVVEANVTKDFDKVKANFQRYRAVGSIIAAAVKLPPLSDVEINNSIGDKFGAASVGHVA